MRWLVPSKDWVLVPSLEKDADYREAGSRTPSDFVRMESLTLALIAVRRIKPTLLGKIADHD